MSEKEQITAERDVLLDLVKRWLIWYGPVDRNAPPHPLAETEAFLAARENDALKVTREDVLSEIARLEESSRDANGRMYRVYAEAMRRVFSDLLNEEG